jgi:hypothetical protein
MEFALKPPERLITPVIRIFSWQEFLADNKTPPGDNLKEFFYGPGK